MPHLGADAVVEGARKTAAAPFEIGEDPVPPFGVQPSRRCLKKPS
jgi:hypothetical protein